VSRGTLVCPADNPIQSQKNKGYESLAINLEKLRKYEHDLPCGLRLDKLDEGDGILSTFILRKAKWHKACLLRYSSRKFVKLLSNLSNEELAQSENFGGEEPVQNIGRATRSSEPMVNVKNICFICTPPGTWRYPLHMSETDDIYQKVLKIAEETGDTKTAAILLTGGDMVAQEVKCHAICLARYYTRGRKYERAHDGAEDSVCASLAFADLLFYVKGKIEEHRENVVLKMALLKSMYMSRLAQLLEKKVADVADE